MRSQSRITTSPPGERFTVIATSEDDHHPAPVGGGEQGKVLSELRDVIVEAIAEPIGES